VPLGLSGSAINRRNVWAAAHDAYYDSRGLVAGADSLTDVERAGRRRRSGDHPPDTDGRYRFRA
jgi:hypothetical protein